MSYRDIFAGIVSILFLLIICFIFYSTTMQLTKSIKEKKWNMKQTTYFSIFSILEIIIIELIQENLSMKGTSLFVTFLFLYFLNYNLSRLKNYKIFIILKLVIMFIYSIIQRFVFMFKGNPFSLGEISAIGTAIEVANKYVFRPTTPMIISFVIMVLVILGLIFIPYEKDSEKKQKIILIESIAYLIFLILPFFNSYILYFFFSMKYWNPGESFNSNGCLAHLYIDAVESQFKYPKGYNEQIVEEALNNIEINKTSGTQAVNIICILEESLFDLNLIDDLELNKDNLSFYHSLKKNTIKGNTIVSGFGGSTANSEYEFLTNGNMFFLTKGTYPFTKLIKSENKSLASVLKEHDFKTISFHPFSKQTWNRPNVYSFLGFDEYYALEDLPNLEDNTENYLRNTISDKADVKQIIEFYENKEEGENLFIYNVTIQNHAGYEEDFGLNEIYSNKYNSKTLSTYLTLVNESDEAIKELIEYFDKVEEPTLICIFGDHYPGTFDNNDVVDQKLRGSESLLGDEKLLRYTTPFLIHTNYDIEETSYEDGISLSYLSTLVMDYANLPKSKEQALVQSFMDKYPIINEWGYKVNNEWFYRGDIQEDLNLWRDLTYYNLNY